MVTTVYVLKCKENKYYVGKTNSPLEDQIVEHFSKYGSGWTQRYLPTALVDTIKNADEFEEAWLIKYQHDRIINSSECCIFENEVIMDRTPKVLRRFEIYESIESKQYLNRLILYIILISCPFLFGLPISMILLGISGKFWLPCFAVLILSVLVSIYLVGRKQNQHSELDAFKMLLSRDAPLNELLQVAFKYEDRTLINYLFEVRPDLKCDFIPSIKDKYIIRQGNTVVLEI